MSKRKPSRITVRITNSCNPNPAKFEAGIQMWAAFAAENIRKEHACAPEEGHRAPAPADV